MITIILSGVKCYLWSKETLILSFHIELYFVGLLFTSYKQFFIFVTEGVKTQKREDIKTPLAVGGIKIIYCPNFQLFYKMSLECIIRGGLCFPVDWRFGINLLMIWWIWALKAVEMENLGNLEMEILLFKSWWFDDFSIIML